MTGAGARQQVLVVDDEPLNRELLVGYLEALDCDVVEAAGGDEALDLVSRRPPDLILLDIMMAGPTDGLQVCRRLKSDPSTRLIPMVLVSALNSVDTRTLGYDVGADDYLAKPVARAELIARARSLLALKAIFDRLDQAEVVVLAFAHGVEARDPGTGAHQERVAAMAVSTGISLGLRDRELADLRFGALVHDIGKIGVPDSILLKRALLTEPERLLMEEHPATGERILSPLNSLSGALPVVRHHHERYDGTGYPDGLAGEAIPLAARIVAVCDAYDAMTSDRPYRRRLDPRTAQAELRGQSGLIWDRKVVDAFLAVESQVAEQRFEAGVEVA